jgi:hypothetical protein
MYCGSVKVVCEYLGSVINVYGIWRVVEVLWWFEEN